MNERPTLVVTPFFFPSNNTIIRSYIILYGDIIQVACPCIQFYTSVRVLHTLLSRFVHSIRSPQHGTHNKLRKACITFCSALFFWFSLCQKSYFCCSVAYYSRDVSFLLGLFHEGSLYNRIIHYLLFFDYTLYVFGKYTVGWICLLSKDAYECIRTILISSA